MDTLIPLKVLTIVLMAVVTYLTRVLGFVGLRGRTLRPRIMTVLQAAPGCVLISVMAPEFVSPVIIGIASAGILRHLMP